MAEESRPKWQGKVTAKVPEYTANQIWPLLSDFLSLHKWFSAIDTCTLVEGTPNQPGCVRHCTTDKGEGKIIWAKEKLLAIDPVERWFTYEIGDNNIGFKTYVATIKVCPDGRDGCLVEWSFVCDPIEGWKLENFFAYLDSGLLGIVKKMEEALQTDQK